MDGLGAELRVAIRTLGRRPGFAAVVILTLALGIGANTAFFGIARDVLLRPFPYPDAERVVVVLGSRNDQPGVFGNVSYPNMVDLEASTSSFDELAVIRWWEAALELDDRSEVVMGGTVSSNFFDVLGVRAGVGRFFAPDEQGEGREATVVISHGLWVDGYGADPGLVGRSVRLSGTDYRVIGVTPEDFEDPWLLTGPERPVAVWRTVSSPVSEWPRGGRSWRAVGRLLPGVGREVAQADTDRAWAELEARYPDNNALRSVQVQPLLERVTGPVSRAVWVLTGAVGLLLLIACTNLANLMLGRALDRRGDYALQRALGASGARVVRSSLLESGVLAATGGALGLVVAGVLGQVARTRAPALLPRPITGEVDLTLAMVALVTTVGAALLFGGLPALEAARSEASAPGRDDNRTATGGRRDRRLRRNLVIAEVVVTTALLVGAGLLTRSVQRLEDAELGLDPEGVLTVQLHGSAWYDLDEPAGLAQWRRILDATAALPGVTAVGAVDIVPLSGSYSCDGTSRVDLPEPEVGEGQCAEARSVLPGTLEALGVALVRGRLHGWGDGADAPRAAVIDELAARTWFPEGGTLGGRLRVHSEEWEVVGVVEAASQFGATGDVRPVVYLSAPQEPWGGASRGMALVVRGPGHPSDLAGPVRAAVREVNPSIALADMIPLDRLVDRTLAAPRFRAWMMGAFSLTALLLAGLGIGGVMAFSVARRRREIGIRLALGAEPGSVGGGIVREGVATVAVGVAAGLLLAATGAGVLAALLYGAPVHDPVVYAVVGLLLLGVAALACWIPAARAARVDPVTALGGS